MAEKLGLYARTRTHAQPQAQPQAQPLSPPAQLTSLLHLTSSSHFLLSHSFSKPLGGPSPVCMGGSPFPLQGSSGLPQCPWAMGSSPHSLGGCRLVFLRWV